MSLGAGGHLNPLPAYSVWYGILDPHEVDLLGEDRSGHPTKEEVKPYIERQVLYWRAKYQNESTWYFHEYKESLIKLKKVGGDPTAIGISMEETRSIVSWWDEIKERSYLW